MPSRIIHTIVIHCSASRNGVALARASAPGRSGRSAAQVIDGWHRERGFGRESTWRTRYNPHLKSIGYHLVIDADGTVEPGRHRDERGAHVAGHNLNSIGICCVGTDKFTAAQWRALKTQAEQLLERYPHARLLGHRDCSPDRNGNGVIERSECTKTCPGFEVHDWWSAGMQPSEIHIIEAAT